MRTLPLILLLPFALAISQPDSPLGGLAGASLRMGFGANGISLGNAMVAMTSRINAGYYNPALVAFQEGPSAFVSAGILTLDRRLNFVNFATPLPPSAGLSLGIINSGVSEIQGRNANGLKTELYSTSENAFLLSFGLRIHERATIGISTKILYYSLFTELSSTTVGFDLGMVYQVTEELIAALCLQDIGSKYRWDTSRLYGLNGRTTTDHFPVRKRAGIAYNPAFVNLRAGVEYELIAGMSVIRGGMELELTEAFSLRAGIDNVVLTHALPARPTFGFTTGTSIGTWQSWLSYGFVLEPHAPGSMHYLTIGVEFP